MVTSSSPGRINIIGDHIDYNQGVVLPASIDKKCTFHLDAISNNTMVSITAIDKDEVFEFDIKSFSPLERGGWPNYVMGVVHELLNIGADIKGFKGSFKGDVPIGSGMSSSAALECSLATGLNALFNLNLSNWELAKACQLAEHNFVGIKCGIMDQFASLMGKKGNVLSLDCRSFEYKYHPFDLGAYCLLLFNTNVTHELASSEYNQRTEECQKGLAALHDNFHITSLRDANISQLKAIEPQINKNIFKRCRHVITEIMRVENSIIALKNNDIHLIGDLMYQSHSSLSEDYNVSCPELDFMVEYTKDKDYILGSRMMGGGFGGCTINIVKQSKTDQLIKELSTAYHHRFDKNLSEYTVEISDGARVH